MKEYTDAEGLMSLPTSDFHRPSECIGRLKPTISNNYTNTKARSGNGPRPSAQEFGTITLPIETPLRLTNAPYSNNLIKTNCNNSADLASLDSSDTYASCQTHPFLSQGDLTGELADISCTLAEFEIDDLYMTSLERDRHKALSTTSTGDPLKISSDIFKSKIKKSASGDASVHSLGGGAPMEEIFKTFQSFDQSSRADRGSNISLNEATIPKHRKTRFQKGSLNKGSKGTTPSTNVSELTHTASLKKQSHDSLAERDQSLPSAAPGKKIRRSSFMPTKSLASATKLINQHLFPITRGK